MTRSKEGAYITKRAIWPREKSESWDAGASKSHRQNSDSEPSKRLSQYYTRSRGHRSRYSTRDEHHVTVDMDKREKRVKWLLYLTQGQQFSILSFQDSFVGPCRSMSCDVICGTCMASQE